MKKKKNDHDEQENDDHQDLDTVIMNSFDQDQDDEQYISSST